MEGGVGMKVSKIKAKVAAKVGKAKAKVAEKCGKTDAAKKVAAKVATVVALALVIAGCASTGEQPARSQTMHNNFDECIVIVAGKVTLKDGKVKEVDGEGGLPALELFTQTQANEGSETIAPKATPTNTTDVDAALDVPVNKGNAGTSAAGGAAERLLGAGADWLSSKMGTGGAGSTATANAKAATTTTTDCKDGSCTDTGGDCKDGSCTVK
jgi:hypothetical protein